MHYTTNTTPFFFQLDVCPDSKHALSGKIHGCLATIIVFAKSGEKAMEIMGRHIAAKNWTITKLKRMQVLSRHNIDNMQGAIKKAYIDAQYLGLGSIFDTW